MTARSSRAKQQRIEKMLQMLTEKGMTGPELARKFTLDRSTTRQYIEQLRDQLFIESWYRPRNEWSPVWRCGIGIDAPKPELEPYEEADMDKRPAVQINVHRHPLDVALFGEYRRAA